MTDKTSLPFFQPAPGRRQQLIPEYLAGQGGTQQSDLEQSALQLQVLLEQHSLQAAKAQIEAVEPVILAKVIQALPEPSRAIAFRLLSQLQAAEVYQGLDAEAQRLLVAGYKHQEVLDRVDKILPEERSQLFDELPATVVVELLEPLSLGEQQVKALLGYKPNTAGWLIRSCLALPVEWSVTQALEQVKWVAKTAGEIPHYFYIIDGDRRLVGLISLGQLLSSQPEQTIGGTMTQEVVSVPTHLDLVEVAQQLQHHNVLALPVVDSQYHLVGTVPRETVMATIQNETEAATPSETSQTGSDSYFQTNLLTVARRRMVWLLVLLLTNTITSAVIRSQEDILEQVVILAAFIPLLIGTGGNVGAQSSTVVIRGLHSSRPGGSWWMIRREAIAGVFLGLMLGIVVAGWAYILHGSWTVAIAVGISLAAISVLASVSGSALPFLFHRLGFDPALMSAPFITTAVDVFGVLIYFGIARLILQQLS